MGDPAGETDRGALRLDFVRSDRRAAEPDHQAVVVGLLAYRELDGRLAGYEDVNDAERLCRDSSDALGGRR